ncbi:globin-coupled sensor protein [Roseomonas sp. USHLN139]|uniref:globin-coupled sensor protein n=1 Tax=Roseomonas sp. USHLN139 TaxID=3081298 RepID=UPI003B028E71
MPLRNDGELQKRLTTFKVTPEDVAVLKGMAEYGRTRLPQLLQELHVEFAGWPEIQAALTTPEVHRARVSHWCRVATGDLGPGFTDSAQTLASLFYDHGVPGYALAICHASVMNGILRDLGIDEAGRAKSGWFGRGGPRNAAAIRSALNKGAWFDLELLLEVYTAAEQKSRSAALNNMAEAIEREAGLAVEKVSKLTADMSGTAKAMAATAARTGQNAGEAAAAADQTRHTAETVATAAEQLTTSIHEIVRQVSGSTASAQRAVVAGRDARNSIEAMSQQAAQIGRIAEIIADIAARTNLLALNATIEAARAGDAGKGFAVVAGEVKQLATQTAQSTADITRQIAAVRQATQLAADEVSQVVGLIGEIDTTTSAVAAAVEAQGSATAAIARSVAETAGAASRMSQRTDDVRAAAGEADRQSEAVRQTAGVLDEAVRQLRQTVIRVVRTSTKSVDRREGDRVDVDLPARLTLSGGGQGEAVRVTNLSDNGALVSGASPAAAGAQGRLQVEGLDIAASCVGRRGPALVLRLMPDERQQQQLLALLSRQQAA